MSNKTKKQYQKLLLGYIEKELLVVLAVIVILGILVGYSLAAAKYQPTLTTPESNSSLLRADLSDSEFD